MWPRMTIIRRVGWFTPEPGKETTQSKEEIEEERTGVLKYLGTDGREIHWNLIRRTMCSIAQLTMIPLQEVLGLGSECRMNCPGTLLGVAMPSRSADGEGWKPAQESDRFI